MKILFAAATFSFIAYSAMAQADEETTSPAASGGDKSIVMLKVNGDEIKKSEIDDDWKAIFQGHDIPPFETFDPKMKDKFLREVASEHVLYKEALKEGVQNSEEAKVMLEKVREQVIIQLLLKEKTKDDTSDEKLKAAYEMHIKASENDAGNQDEFKARHILVKTKAEADAVEKKLKAGGDFEQIAKQQSEDKGSGASGGELGWFTGDKMVPEFSAAVAKMKKGEISPPVKSDFGWHVIQLEDRRKATPPSFDQVKETLKQEVGNKAIGKYISNLMANAKITEVDAKGQEIALPDPKDSASAPAGAAE